MFTAASYNRGHALLFMVFVAVVALGQPLVTVGQTLSEDAAVSPVEEPAPAPEMPVGPSVSSVSVTDITDTSARIDVNSDEMVQGYVEYGTTKQYGMSTPLSSEFTTNPEFLLENLTPETLYHYRVVVMDSSGSAAITTDETFTTLATPEPEPETPPADTTATTTPSTGDTGTATTTESTGGTATSTPPEPTPALSISNTETVSVSTTTARITWQTNASADSQVQYGLTSSYGTRSPIGVFETSHSITLSSLTPNTKYYYRAISKTSSGETAYGSAQQFTTLAVKTAPTPPTISNVAITAVATSSATISWTTSKSATSDIQYGTSTSYASSLGTDSTLRMTHSRSITGLTPSTLYHFRIRVTDSAGNTALGKDRSFTTNAVPAAESTASTSAETLAEISARAAQAVQAAPQGGGGLPVTPSRPLLLKVTPLDGQVVFDWRKDRGVKNGTIHTLIVRKVGTDPVRSRIDGDIIYDGPSITFTDTSVENGKEYHYALYSYGQYGRFTTAARFKVIPRADKEQVNLWSEEEEEFIPLDLSRNLFQGRQGDDVALLQAHLAGNGYYPEALVTGYFGPLTRKAVIHYQTLNSVVPAVGYVGPITRESLAQ